MSEPGVNNGKIKSKEVRGSVCKKYSPEPVLVDSDPPKVVLERQHRKTVVPRCTVDGEIPPHKAATTGRVGKSCSTSFQRDAVSAKPGLRYRA